MPWGPRQRIHTPYDVMEANGVFASNPANPGSADAQGNQLYKGPVKFPQMFYHPSGEERILVPGEELRRPDGQPVMDYKTNRPMIVGELKEIIWQIAADEGEAEALRMAGWHDHPAKAIHAAGGVAPPISSAEQMSKMEEEIARLQSELATAKAGSLGKSGGVKSAS